jgi:hypothetical protein
MRGSFLFAAMAGVWSLACSQDSEKKEAKSWRDLAAEMGLTAPEVDRLAAEKVLVSRIESKQSFSVYLRSRLPNFITSDAVLNAYHVLYEETLRQQEEVNAGALRSFCPELWKLLATIDRSYSGDVPRIKAAQQRARFVLGVAVKLLDDDISSAPEPLKRAIEAEAAAIEKAEGSRRPEMLGLPEPDFVAFDYTLFRPTGFYAESPRLQRYFRAVRWLQMVPFRAENEEELLAWHMMEEAISSPHVFITDGQVGSARKFKSGLPEGGGAAAHDRLRQSMRVSEFCWVFLGADPANVGLGQSKVGGGIDRPIKVDAPFLREQLTEVQDRASWEKQLRPSGNDRVRRTDPAKGGPEFRTLVSFRLPEDKAMTAALHAGENPPGPGVLFGAWLGVPKAEAIAGSGIVAAVAAHRPSFESYRDEKLQQQPWWQRIGEGYTVALPYRAALRHLVEVDPRAPAFMRGSAWETKTLQTIAASWAQERHAWALQAKPEVHVMSASPLEQGFIEPAPEFFLRMSWVAQAMSRLARSSEAACDPVAPVIDSALDSARSLRTMAAAKPTKEEIFGELWTATNLLGTYDESMDESDWDKPTVKDLLAVADAMDRLAARLRKDAAPGSPLWQIVQEHRLRTDALWQQLAMLCLRLSMLADKQLSGIPFTGHEAGFIEHIAVSLSEIMLYRGQAMMFPSDDAPRIARISSDPRHGSVVHAAIGRPRVMYVLYPWQKKEVLCRGVAMPYHEVTDQKTLTDEEWRQEFNKDTRPAVPEWLKELVPVDGVKLAKRRGEE